ncbi:MAG: hypothetical protein Q9220_001322 [cf. Caloplaca sp. 1 TL-2023]
MDSNFLAPASAASAVITRQKEKTMQVAREQQQALAARLRKNNVEMPPFEFLELIGKGAFGRVFKANDLERNKVVALKVVDVDPHDYKVHHLEKDESIQTVMHEIKVLRQLRDNNAKNINLIIDAFPIHSQLWIVTEYCPGGSLHTLMQGVGSKLEERYIIPVARELAVALKAIHATGIIHRDVKAANVMIHENGSLQLIDFGVAGLLQTSKDKRSTIIGTPHWMPPEMSSQLTQQGPPTLDYSTEIDVWAYGCTLFEIATGNPPYHRFEPGRKLTMMLKRSAPNLKEKGFSDGLVDLVEYIMQTSPQDRPSMQDVLQHAYISKTEEEYPTKSLANLVKMYYRWECSGGQRSSLFMPGGAEAAAFPKMGDDDEEWNFSTTMNFDAQNLVPYTDNQHNSASVPSFNFDSDALNLSTPQPSQPSLHKPNSSLNFSFSMSDSREGSTSSISMSENTTPVPQGMATKAATEGKVERGEKSLRAIFDPSAPDYQYGAESKSDDGSLNSNTTLNSQAPFKPSLDRSKSDLPLRNATSGVAVHKEVDKSGIVKTPSIDLANVNTIKAARISSRSGQSADRPTSSDTEGEKRGFAESAKRATMEWTFATAQETPKEEETPMPPRPAQRGTLDWSFATAGASTVTEDENEDNGLPARPALRHMTTAPVGVMDPRPKSVLDLDELFISDSSYESSSAMNTAPASDDETYAAYDLSDASEPVDLGPVQASEAEVQNNSVPHPLSSLRAPAKLKMKMLKKFVLKYDIDMHLAEQLIIGDPSPPPRGNVSPGDNDESFAIDCVNKYLTSQHSDKHIQMRMDIRSDILTARRHIFAKYLSSDYPFEKYYTVYDFELLGQPYDSDGGETSSDSDDDDDDKDNEVSAAEDTEVDEAHSPLPEMRGVDIKALMPGAGDERLRAEFEAQIDQYTNMTLPWVQRKLEKAKEELEVDGNEGNGVAGLLEEEEGVDGGDEA